MITWTLVTVLGALLVLVLVKLSRKPAAPVAEMPPVPDLANLKPADARTGDVISVSGAGDEMSDLDFTVERCSWVQAGSRRWTELSGSYRGRRVALRAATGEDTTTCIQVDPRRLTLDELGVSEDDLATMDERQNTADNFEFDGKMWQYRLSREVQVTRDDQPQPTGFYYWEYQEEGGPGQLSIRKLAGEPFSVTLFRCVNPADVTVFRARG